MKILVPFKQVAHLERAEQISQPFSSLRALGLEMRPNPYDEYALEAALRLTENGTDSERRLGEVVVASLGSQEVNKILKAALAIGADRAIWVSTPDESLDGDLVARTLQSLVELEKPDLVLLGQQAADTDSCQVASLLASYLKWPQATSTTFIESEKDTRLLIHREGDFGVLRMRLILPAVVSVNMGVVGPQSVRSAHTPIAHVYPQGVRIASLRGLMSANKKPLVERSQMDLLTDTKLKIVYSSCEPLAPRKAGIRVSTVQELVHHLKEAKVI
ncbi:hypothetical protein BCY86_02205 [Pajaroellobacter abortibovis]|uniref:Electron transfer flavoprotein alpha/beta-subunit N-terminal domain-containing protein n=1 Tax=Pajaroellobacter abortibovis TaxID=1882918 RepID=A0A1L6MZM7_9BACT|nr:hypothetical protein BCY86_02205 [Pajaroellobacter abortibovis]